MNDVKTVLQTHIHLLQTELDRIDEIIDASPVGERRDELERIYESISNVMAVMKTDLKEFIVH
jgi:hypothetical protein